SFSSTDSRALGVTLWSEKSSDVRPGRARLSLGGQVVAPMHPPISVLVKLKGHVSMGTVRLEDALVCEFLDRPLARLDPLNVRSDRHGKELRQERACRRPRAVVSVGADASADDARDVSAFLDDRAAAGTPWRGEVPLHRGKVDEERIAFVVKMLLYGAGAHDRVCAEVDVGVSIDG